MDDIIVSHSIVVLLNQVHGGDDIVVMICHHTKIPKGVTLLSQR
jgi:hypothetical protein